MNKTVTAMYVIFILGVVLFAGYFFTAYYTMPCREYKDKFAYSYAPARCIGE